MAIASSVNTLFVIACCFTTVHSLTNKHNTGKPPAKAAVHSITAAWAVLGPFVAKLGIKPPPAPPTDADIKSDDGTADRCSVCLFPQPQQKDGEGEVLLKSAGHSGVYYHRACLNLLRHHHKQ